jgi:tRNA pseudouridine38-40 synthase
VPTPVPHPVPHPVRLRLTLAFEGTHYAGWQQQASGVAVQEVVEQALAQLFPSRPRLQGSSRTDSGVHALGLVAHCDIPRAEFRFPAAKLLLAVNAHLPEDIRVLAARRVPAGFHARFDARGKQYRYFVWNHPAWNPLQRHLAWHVPRRLDLAAMRRAARQLLGTHDFRAFTANRGVPLDDAVRTLTRCDVQRRGPLLTFVIEGNGFLYKMCRALVGTLVQLGLGRLTAADLERILASRDRRTAGMTAPAHGLVLWQVHYAPAHRSGPAPVPVAASDARRPARA